jgi:hypothetical protein
MWEHNLELIPKIVLTGRRHGVEHMGGVIEYGQVRRDVLRWLRHDQNADARVTSMVDLFRLPADFPGFAECQNQPDPIRRAEGLEQRWREDVGDKRFIPYIQVHEFEALVFSDPSKVLLAHPDRAAEVQELAAVRARYPSPEYIDDGPTTAPSKRILALIPGYSKPTSGSLILRGIGLARLRQECTHFNLWLARLESFGRPE